jgi:hypothetical protein
VGGVGFGWVGLVIVGLQESKWTPEGSGDEREQTRERRDDGRVLGHNQLLLRETAATETITPFDKLTCDRESPSTARVPKPRNWFGEGIVGSGQVTAAYFSEMEEVRW